MFAYAAAILLTFADGLGVQLVTQPVILERLQAGMVPRRERQTVIAKLFTDSGCQVELQKVDGHFSNVICRLPGDTDETIVVGGHTDFIDAGKGIVDDWSGSSLLPSLYQSLKLLEHRKHTYEFVAFTAEERGLVGSTRYVKELSPERRGTIKAFINLECVGLTTPKVWVRRSTPLLVDLFGEIANATQTPVQGVNVDNVGDDDTHPFLDKKMRVICIHSVTQETIRILHSNRDNLSAINPADYYATYRLVAFYLEYLDTKLTQ
jgi:Zn-dependent M28 family amino/carboxypeptidase